jgi:Xaa-Pro dipeptidase
MKQCNLDVLIATSATNVNYFSGYSCWLDPLFKEYMMSPGTSSNLAQRSYAMFACERAPALIVKSLMAAEAADIQTDLRVYGDPGFDYSLLSNPATATESRYLALFRNTPRSATAVDSIVGVLNDWKLTGATIGVEMEDLPSGLKTELSLALPQARLKDCSNLIRLVRAVKTQNEIDLLARAAEIAEQAAQESLALVRVGGRARDLVQHFRSRVGDQGAAFDHFSFSLSGMGICTAPDYVFRSEDILFIDYGCIFSSYFSDTGTTLALSDPSPGVARRHSALRSCIEVGARGIRPGVKASSIQKTMGEALKDSGITDSFPHGHGMGLELRDYPILVPANGCEIRDDCVAVNSDLSLEAGMVINLEAPLFMPLAGALQVEKTFVVTSDGYRELLPQDRSRPYRAAKI